ncbi:hypothetical protein DAH66_12630 [Sphingomonas koreensis]|uniref:Sialate O-acetylesterase domain-containing protein n=1 Tax=Sphingomonas koreensis TaxID=93064 RepID=A0A430G2B1_9SPHN|nr:sialate O-acetylesterase [Sphingomonas koreensis]RSY83108.1 hypothetical protein DAH66_12630 [Sphingomonas koreensis]
MAVTVEIMLAGPFTPNGVATSFAFDFKALSESEIDVYQGSVGEEGVVDTALYSVAFLAGSEGGSVNFSDAPAVGSGDIWIAAAPSFQQQAGFSGGETPFSPKDVNTQFDRAAMRALVLRRDVDRALKVPLGAVSLGVGLILPGEVLGRVGNELKGVVNSAVGAENSANAAAVAAAAAAADRIAVAADKLLTAGYRTVAQQQAATATTQAGIATAGALASKTQVWASATTPPDGVGNGSHYWVVDEHEEKLLLYLNTSGTGAPSAVPVSIPTTATMLDALGEFVAAQERAETLTDGLLGYTGPGPLIPIAGDRWSNLILAFDETAQSVVGLGLTVGSGDGGAVAPAPLVDLIAPCVPRAWNVQVAYGQSNGAGAGGRNAITLTQPYANLTWPGGVRFDGYDFSASAPLVENNLDGGSGGGSGRGESICAAAANMVGTLIAIDDDGDPEDYVIFATCTALGGATMAELEKGSAQYNGVLLPNINSIKALQSDVAVHVVNFVHGEQDADNGLAGAAYKADLIQLQADLQADIQTRTGQTSPVYMVISQCSWRVQHHSAIALAQYEVAQESRYIFLANPTYHLDFREDAVHHVNTSHRLLGGKFGVCDKRIMIDGKEPRWIRALRATVRGKKVAVTFDVPHPPLVLDGSTISMTQDYGFVVTDGGAPAEITKVEARGATVEITLADVPVGAVVVRYALDHLRPGVNLGVSTGDEGASGNLRDCAPETIWILGTEHRLFNWCPAFPPLTATRLGD